jgi:signal transduction histidine kinase
VRKFNFRWFFRLRTFLFSAATIALGVILFFSVQQTESTLKKSYEVLRQQHAVNISAVITSALENKKQELLNMGRILRSDNDLSSGFMLSMESQNFSLIESKIKSIKDRVGFEWVGILSLNGKPTLDRTLPSLDPSLVNQLLDKDQERVITFKQKGMLYLASVSTIKLYDKPVGILLLGQNLDLLALGSLGPLTKSTIRFYNNLKLVLPNSSTHTNMNSDSIDVDTYNRLVPIALGPTSQGPVIYASIDVIENPDELIDENLGLKLFAIGAFCLAALIFLFNIILEISFVRPYQKIIKEVDLFTRLLSTGRLRPVVLPKFRIAENEVLAESFTKLSHTLILYEKEIKEKTRNEGELKRNRDLTELASQVAHDIRSPLAALEIAIKLMPEITEDKRLLVRGAVTRIRDIANDLLARFRRNSDVRGPELLSSLLESIVSEKRVQYSGRTNIEIDLTLDSNSYGAFSVVSSSELKRVMSNLINNAVEALKDEPGTVVVRLQRNESDKQNVIKISDDGPGIPSEVVAKIGHKGNSFGKSDGSGLGLAYAKETVEACGGMFKVETKIGIGTTVFLSLPSTPAPKWFLEEIRVKPCQKIVIFDDDSSIHHVWEKRFQVIQKTLPELKKLNILHFSNTTGFKEWFTASEYFGNPKALESGNILFLVDFEIRGERATGLDLIKEFKLSQQSVLVTSRFEEDSIRHESERQRISLIPKGMAPFVPIRLSSQITQSTDTALYDSETLLKIQFAPKSSSDTNPDTRGIKGSPVEKASEESYKGKN